MANGHYVPQFYLRNFAIPAKPGFVYSYLRNRKPILRPISRVASADEFYAVRWDTNPRLEPDSLDRVYGMSESHGAPVISQLLSGSEFRLSRPDWLMLVWFVALLAGRTTLVREQYKKLTLALRKRDIKAFAARREEFEEFARSLEPDISPEQLEERRQIILNFDENLQMSFGNDGETDYNIKGFGMMLTADVRKILVHRRWHLLESAGVRNFVTSDNPVVLLPPPGSRTGFGWGYHNSPILIPLSPQRALLIDDRIQSRGIIKVSKEKMIEYIFYVVTQAHKAEYASEASTEVQEMFNKTTEGSLCEVHLE